MRWLAKVQGSNHKFRFAYSNNRKRGPKVFEDFAEAVYSVLDGNHITQIPIEEYGSCCAHPGNLDPDSAHGLLWSESRKYGGIMSCLSQKPQKITKDAIDNAGVIWAGAMGVKPAKQVAVEMNDMNYREILNTTPGEFYHWQRGKGPAERIRLFTPKPQ